MCLSAEGPHYAYWCQTPKNNREGRGWSCSHYRATGPPTRGSDCCRGMCKAREGSSKATEFTTLLGNSFRVWPALSTPALTGLSRGNTCSDANEGPTCRSFRRESCRRSGEIGIQTLKDQISPQIPGSGPARTESNFKVSFISRACEYQDWETTNPYTVLIAMYSTEAMPLKKKSQVR